MASRHEPVQQPPDLRRDYSGFPARTITAGTTWYRHHHQSHSPWWFTPSMTARFDLPPPYGTCYLTGSWQAAVREHIGPDLAAHARVASSIVADRVVSTLELPTNTRAAALDTERAANHFGVTAELTTTTTYQTTQAWARRLHASGFDAITAYLGFTPSRHSYSLALFGQSGPRSHWPTDQYPEPLAELARRMHIDIIDPPDGDQLTITSP